MILELLEGGKTPRTPVWFMRQAGRYMAEYRKTKEKHSFIEMCMTPEIAAEVAQQPVRKFGFDAAIIFSDILIPLGLMGLKLEFNPGPSIKNPPGGAEDIAALKIPPAADFNYIAEAVRLARLAIPEDKDVIGFCGAPFTLSCYAVKGQSDPGFAAALKFKDSEIYGPLAEKLLEAAAGCALAQVKAGAKVIQIFDTWAGILDAESFAKYAMPYADRLGARIKSAGGRVIYFFRNGSGLAEAAGKMKNVDVMSVDHSISLREFDEKTGHRFILQGNMEPGDLLKGRNEVRKSIDEVFRDAKGLRGHIFNLGHGVLKETPEENVKFAVDYIKEAGQK